MDLADVYRMPWARVDAASSGVNFMDQVIQIAGALLILIAFMAAQLGRLSVESQSYLALNLVGSVILAVLALYEQQWGFLLLEVVWAVVSLWSLVQVLRHGGPPSAHPPSPPRDASVVRRSRLD